MPDDRVTLVEVEPRRTAVIADTVAWEDFPELWRPMLDEVYVFVRQCPEFAAALEGTPGPALDQRHALPRRGAQRRGGRARPERLRAAGRVIASELPGGRARHARPTTATPRRSARPTTRCASTRATTGWPPPASCGRSTATRRRAGASPPRCSTSSRLDFPGRKAYSDFPTRKVDLPWNPMSLPTRRARRLTPSSAAAGRSSIRSICRTGTGSAWPSAGSRSASSPTSSTRG